MAFDAHRTDAGSLTAMCQLSVIKLQVLSLRPSLLCLCDVVIVSFLGYL